MTQMVLFAFEHNMCLTGRIKCQQNKLKIWKKAIQKESVYAYKGMNCQCRGRHSSVDRSEPTILLVMVTISSIIDFYCGI